MSGESPRPGGYNPHPEKLMVRAREALIIGAESRDSYINKNALKIPGVGSYQKDFETPG